MDIKGIRDRHGLTQRQLAQRLGVTVLTIKWWESGERSPSRRHQLQLAQLDTEPLVSAQPAAASVAPSVAPPAVAIDPTREVVHLKEVVRRFGLMDGTRADGQRRSDRTWRNWIRDGKLRAWKVNGYRYAEWAMHWDDAVECHRLHYHPERDPRRNGKSTRPVVSVAPVAPAPLGAPRLIRKVVP